MANSGSRQAVKQLEQQQYQKIVQHYDVKPSVVRNCVKAFFIGGTVCVIGQLIQNAYMTFFGFTQEKAGDPTVATMILIACLLTGLGWYDKIAKWAGAGTAVPVTGFANTMTATAMEHKSEGLVLGVGGNLFKLAGSVIAFGVVAAFLITLVKRFVT